MTPAATSALLPQEPVLLVQGRLAAALGLAPALFLQQVHYWLLRSRHEFGGQLWIYNTYAQWQTQFPFLSRDQLARAVATLRRLGVLQVAHWDADRRERRNWYSIDYARLAAVLGTDAVSAPLVADLADNVSMFDTSALRDTACVLSCDSTLASIPTPSLLANVDEAEAASVRPGSAERTPIVRICTMDDSPVAAHPEITRSEITQRLPQEEEEITPAHLSPPPPPALCVSEAIAITPAAPAPAPCPGPSLRTCAPSAPDGAESWDGIALPSALGGRLRVPSIRPSVPDVRIGVPYTLNRTSHFALPRSAFVWGAYRATLDPGAPPALRGRIAADLAGAAAREVPLTARGLTYALREAATARGPRWPYLFAVWQAHPDGERGTRNAELPKGERGTRNMVGDLTHPIGGLPVPPSAIRQRSIRANTLPAGSTGICSPAKRQASSNRAGKENPCGSRISEVRGREYRERPNRRTIPRSAFRHPTSAKEACPWLRRIYSNAPRLMPYGSSGWSSPCRRPAPRT